MCKSGETKQLKYVKIISKHFTYLCKYGKFIRKLFNIVKKLLNNCSKEIHGLCDYVFLLF